MNDIDLLISQAQKLFPGKPVFLYGHSLGGLLVLDYAMQRPVTSLKGIIATSPALGTASPVPAWKLTLANVMKTINPSMTMTNGLDLSAISHNPAVITAYKTDPLVHPLISARLGWDLDLPPRQESTPAGSRHRRARLRRLERRHADTPRL